MRSNPTKDRAGFTLVEILVAIMILVIGILAVCQMTIIGMGVTRSVDINMRSRESLAKAMEVLKLLNQNDPLLTPTCTYATIDNCSLGVKADSTNIVGRTLAPLRFEIWWNVAPDYPQTGLRTIRLFVLNKGKRTLTADFVRWR